MNDACEYGVEKLGAVAKVGEAFVVVIKGSEIVEETRWDSDGFEDDKDEGVRHRGEGGAKVEEYEDRSE